MAPASATRRRPRRTTVQYFEMFGNRGIYHEGWTAVTKHRTPWKADAAAAVRHDVWELYGPDDWTQAKNIVAENPKKLAEMQRLWLIEAVKYNVVPLDDRGFERINPDIAGRPQLIRGNTQLLFPGMRVSEACVLTLKNKSHSVTAELTIPEGGAKGVIITQGGEVGGWTLYAKRGQAQVLLQLLRHRLFLRRGRQADPSRQASGADGVQIRRRRPRQGRRRHALLRRQAGRQRAASSSSSPMGYSADEACDVGSDTGSPASPDYGPSGNAFTGDIDWVQIDLGDDDHDHLITPRSASRSRWRGSRAASAQDAIAPRKCRTPLAPPCRRGWRSRPCSLSRPFRAPLRPPRASTSAGMTSTPSRSPKMRSPGAIRTPSISMLTRKSITLPRGPWSCA